MTGTPTAGTGGSTPESYSKTDEPDRRTRSTRCKTEVDQAPGKINRLSVAVLLDSSAVKPADVANWTKQIQTAVGYDAARAATRCRSPSVPFSAAAQKAAKQQLSAGVGRERAGRDDRPRSQHRDAGDHRLVLFFAWRAIKKAESNRVPLRVPLDLRELEAAEPRALLPVGIDAPARCRASTSTRRFAPALDAGSDGELTDLIEHQPDEVAQTLRSWLADRRA